jgi:uncharacterized membrane protein YraQ (UPF0718 family)
MSDTNCSNRIAFLFTLPLIGVLSVYRYTGRLIWLSVLLLVVVLYISSLTGTAVNCKRKTTIDNFGFGDDDRRGDDNNSKEDSDREAFTFYPRSLLE